MNRSLNACIASILFGLSATAQALEGDAERGKAAAAVCAACHQADGSGVNMPGGESWPRLAAMDAGHIYKQLKDFNNGTRINASMAPFAAMLTEQQMKDVAVYYSQLPATEGKGGETADESLLKRGETLATNGDWSQYIPSCRSCHGPENQGAGSHFPGIAGQHAAYIELQIKNWQSGKRSNDPQQLMHAIAERMSEEDIRAVAAWLSRQPAR